MHKAQDLYGAACDHPDQIPPLTLAFLGDAVYELYVRTTMLGQSLNAHTLNRECVHYVNNRTQSALYDLIEEGLNEEETGVLKRGRNAKGIVPKNANMADYRKATAVEALVAYWYLLDDTDRLDWFFAKLPQAAQEAEVRRQHELRR
jgi:ribonuclease-3 family protein